MAAASLCGAVLLLPGLTAHLFSRAATPVARIRAGPGGVVVVDGETLLVGTTVVRLFGVAAPARGTACPAFAGAARDCGAAAANALADLVRNRPVACDLLPRVSTGATSARCDAGGLDLGTSMVASGWARATGEADDLAVPQQAARAARRGVWETDAPD